MTPTLEGGPDLRRQVVRLCGDHTLASTEIALQAVDQDLISTLMFLAIARHNIQAITAQSQATGAYAALADIPPDELRRPITVYALARDLGLPYETARRHANKLVAADLCERTGDGLVIPARVYGRPAMLAAVERNWLQTLQLVETLAALGVASSRPKGVAPSDVRRQVMRHSEEFFLASLDMLTRAVQLDFLSALICAAITRENIRHITKAGRDFAALSAIPPDDQRRPVSVYALSKILRLPYETARRHVGQLVASGVCERLPGGGVIVPGRVHAQPRVMAGIDENWRALSKFLDALAELGVGGQAR